ncbi:MAG: leucyl aminopeptidase [Pseudomonadota bacterium]
MEYASTAAEAGGFTTGCAVIGVYSNKKLTRAGQSLDERLDGQIDRWVRSGEIKAEIGKCTLLPCPAGAGAERIAVVGLGDKKSVDALRFVRAARAAAATLAGGAAVDATYFLADAAPAGMSAYYVGRTLAEAQGQAMYRFRAFKSGRRPPAYKLKKVTIGVDQDADEDAALRGARHAQGIVRGVDLARDLGNTPPNVCTPTYIADRARDLAKRYSKLDIDVLDEADMKALGMNTLLSVGHGSEQPSKLIVLQYRGSKGDEAPIALVGKGITFDTGGISLKPGPGMDEMKFDMCGAAGVLGTLAAACALKLPLNLLVIVPTAENMPSGRASRPGDIVTSMAGKTIEILNTDAEGRLILCDALTYARQFDPQVIIDTATLTGACVIALGRHNAGLLANDDGLAEELLAAGQRSGDKAWRLPMSEEYAEQLRSNFADMANIGGREAGTVTAACFLGKFTEGVPWAHLDIAGTAWLSGSKKGATGRPVPMLTDYLIHAAGLAAD